MATFVNQNESINVHNYDQVRQFKKKTISLNAYRR